MTQTERVFNHLKKHGSITTTEAEKLGVGNMGPIVTKIRRMDHEVICEPVPKTGNPFGFSKPQRRYTLK